MERAHKLESVNQTFEIHVCFSDPGANITTYGRLRFALQASTWFPRPLGILLWSVLHVLLVVGGALLLVPAALTQFVSSVLLEILVFLSIASIWLPALFSFCSLFLLWKMICLGWSVIRFSWSLICENGRLHRIRGASTSFAAWWADASWDSFSTWTLRCWKECREQFCGVEWQPPWLSRRCVKYLVREWLPWYGRVLTRWCEEVVHVHDAIAI